MNSTLSRVRIIVPITSSAFRDETSLKTAVPAACEVTFAHLAYGPASVESAVDEVLAGPGVIDSAIRAEGEGAEALVIDCMLDPALDAVREAVNIPVVGCGEASMRTAAESGAFTVVTVLQRQERAFRDLATRYGIADALKSVRGIGVSVLDLEKDPAASIDATTREARQAIDADGAEVIVFGCTGMLGYALPVARGLGIDEPRVIDPLPHAIRHAHNLVVNGEKTDKQLYPKPEPKRVAGFDGWPALHRLMEPQ